MGGLIANKQQSERRLQLGQPDPKLKNNYTFTAKYTALTFVPKCIILQFMRLSNIVFLCNAILQSIPILSNLSPITAIGPLCFVLFVSLVREGYEDRKRHNRDSDVNSRKTQVLRKGIFEEIEWENLMVGDFVKVKNTQIIPADLLLLHSSEENSMCYVETANLDGQSNLKEKFAFTQGIRLYPEEFQSLKGVCVLDPPKASLHQFDGTITLEGRQQQYVGIDNLLLRETTLRNSEEIIGMAVYCGFDSKILKNQGQVHHKMSQIEKKLNYINVVFLIILAGICTTCCIGYWLVHNSHALREAGTYIPLQGISLQTQTGLNFLSNFILMNYLIPISLVILIQGIKTFLGVFLSVDRKFKDKQTKSSCGVLNSSILEELGVISYVLTDKTGTLTANEMIFKKIAIRDRIYDKTFIQEHIQELKNNPQFSQFMESMVICHEVVRDRHKDLYEGSSPDEVCFINFARDIGYEFIKRTKTHLELNIFNEKKVYEMVDILSFTSRKRMSVAVKDLNRPDQVIVFTKGADSQVLQKAQKYAFQRELNKNITHFAKEGLRTLLFAKKVIPAKKYESYILKRNQAKKSKVEKLTTSDHYSDQMVNLIEQIESDLTIIGASGIEDRLQEDVPETIERLQRAGIVVMMITGDKLETAENIGYLARLIKEDFKVVHLEASIDDLQTRCRQLLIQLERDNEVAVIIEGRQISRMVGEKTPQLVKVYKKILLKAKSVIFCRSSPKEKALIVKFVKENMKTTVLAIGDGGNDVGMIEEANIGVGIIGKQGNSAAAVSDFSFGKFKFIDRLLLHHGRWMYSRLSYFFIVYSWKNIIMTFMMFYANTENTFSGVRTFSEFFYVLWNSFLVIAQIVNSGFYQCDINDDLHPKIWKYLPQIYKQTKEKDLFSYKRFTLWAITGILIALMAFRVISTSLNPSVSMDINGLVPDVHTESIANGIALVAIIIVVIYIDTNSHSFPYELGVFIFGSLICSAAFYITENYFQIFGLYHAYNDNFNLRFYLTIFMVVMMVMLIKMAMTTIQFQMYPTIVDIYKVHMDTNPDILDEIIGKKLSSLSSSKKLSNVIDQSFVNYRPAIVQEMQNVPVQMQQTLNVSQLYSFGYMNKKDSVGSNSSKNGLIVRCQEQIRVQNFD